MQLKSLVISTFVVAIPFGFWLTTRPPNVADINVVTSYDLGVINKGKIAVANLPVRNLGNAPLTIEGISTSCGCTTAKLSPMLIPPGSQANLHVEYNSNAHESDRGKLERYVFISSNDPQERDLQIKFFVFVKVK